MANAYNSCWTGAHNDEYNSRIAGLEGKATTFTAQITTLNNKATTFTAQITTLQGSTTALSTTMNTKVAKAGDTMTGNLTIKDSRLGATAVNFGSKGLIFSDANNNTVGYIDCFSTSGTRCGTRLMSKGTDSNGSAVYHYVRLDISNTGVRSVVISESKPWREAIGVSTYSMVPGNTSQSVTLTKTITTSVNSWQDCLTSWTAPSNGYLQVKFTGAGSTPAAYLQDNTNGFQVRNSGNSGRDMYLTIPCRSGHTYSCGCVYLKTNGATFFPAATGI